MIRNMRYRREQRQMEEEEEIWFNEEDDFADVVQPTRTDIETYSMMQYNIWKIIRKLN